MISSRALAGSPGELSLLCAHISLVRLHNRDKGRLFNRRARAVTDCSTGPTQGHGAQNPPFLAGSALGLEGIFSGLSPACWFGGQPPEDRHTQHRASHNAQDTGRAPRCVWAQEGQSSILILMGLSCLLLQAYTHPRPWKPVTISAHQCHAGDQFWGQTIL